MNNIVISEQELKEFTDLGWDRLEILSTFYQGGLFYSRTTGKLRSERSKKYYRYIWKNRYPELFVNPNLYHD